MHLVSALDYHLPLPYTRMHFQYEHSIHFCILSEKFLNSFIAESLVILELRSIGVANVKDVPLIEKSLNFSTQI